LKRQSRRAWISRESIRPIWRKSTSAGQTSRVCKRFCSSEGDTERPQAVLIRVWQIHSLDRLLFPDTGCMQDRGLRRAKKRAGSDSPLVSHTTWNLKSPLVRSAVGSTASSYTDCPSKHVTNAIKGGGSYTDDDIAAILAADVEQ
jgi:hypothetical protein